MSRSICFSVQLTPSLLLSVSWNFFTLHHIFNILCSCTKFPLIDMSHLQNTTQTCYLSSSCNSKIPWTGGLSNGPSFLSVLKAKKSQSGGAGRFRPGWGPVAWLEHGHAPTTSSRGSERSSAVSSWAPEARTPPCGIHPRASSNPRYLPKCPPPSLITLEIRASTCILRAHKHSDLSTSLPQ